MDRRVPPAELEILSGVTLSVSTMGGYSVHRGSDYLGYIHASATPKWNVYVRRVGQDAAFLGKMDQDAGVKAIVDAWDAALAELNRRQPR